MTVPTKSRPRNLVRPAGKQFQPKRLPGYPWLRTTDGARCLGVSVEWVQEHCRKGAWELGIHYRLVSGSDSSMRRYQIDVEQVAKWMATEPDER